jgi:myo-inositol-1(or 4)-monophosphatase
MTHPSVNLDELHALACRLAVLAGRMVKEGRAEHGIAEATTKSTATDMVTEFDRASEALIVDGILAARPHDTIVGEEGTDRVGTSGVSWLIDPVDGTTNFLYGLPGYAVSIAASLTGDHRAAVGAVYVPATDELFSAVEGRGATLNGAAIRCSTTEAVAQSLVATGFAYRPDRRAVQAARVAALLPHIRDIRRLGAAAPDLCYVAAGRLDAYFEEHLGPWDLAAGELIAREAGCTTGSLDGGPARPSSVIVANPAVFEPLRTAIAEIDQTH